MDEHAEPLERRSSPPRVGDGMMMLLAAAGLAGVTVFDIWIGHDWSVSLFYVAPIVLVAWRGRPSAGWLFCAAAAVAWFFAERYTGRGYDHPLALFENAVVRGGFFALVNLLVLLLRREMERRAQLIEDLQSALAQVRTLTGLLPICAWCRRVRDDAGYWQQVEHYVQAHTGASFTHGICPDCAARVAREEGLDEPGQPERVP